MKTYYMIPRTSDLLSGVVTYFKIDLKTKIGQWLVRLWHRGKWQYKITALDANGKPKAVRMGHGLNNDNWGYFLMALGLSGTSGFTSYFTGVRSDGTNETTVSAWGSTGASFFNSNNSTLPAGMFVQLGTGTVAAARTDIELNTPITGEFGVVGSYAGGSASTITYTATASYTSSYAPTEMALCLRNQVAQTFYFLLDRTVFAALPSSQTFTVTYTITLG